jgi:hypothetical protein
MNRAKLQESLLSRSDFDAKDILAVYDAFQNTPATHLGLVMPMSSQKFDKLSEDTVEILFGDVLTEFVKTHASAIKTLLKTPPPTPDSSDDEAD